MLDYVPYYSTMNSNQDVRIWYSNNPTCGFDGISGVSTVDEARLRKYTQTIAHEIRHLEYYLNPANTIEAYKWQLLRENDNQNLKYANQELNVNLAELSKLELLRYGRRCGR